MSLGGQNNFSVVCPCYDLIVFSAVKDLQLANRTQSIPAQVAQIQRMTIENNYFHKGPDFAQLDKGGLSVEVVISFSTTGIPFAKLFASRPHMLLFPG